MRVGIAIVCCALLVGCHEQPGEAGGAAQKTSVGAETAQSAPSGASSTLTAPSAAKPPTDVISNPMGGYTKDVVAKYNATNACLAGCAAGLRCHSDVLFGGGSVAVGGRLKTCREGCSGDFVKKPAYLEKAKACLSSGSCDKFNTCAPHVLPSKGATP